MSTDITAEPVRADQQKFLSAIPKGQRTPYERLAYLNKPTIFAHGRLCGVLRGWTIPSTIKNKRVLKAEIEISEETEDIGQPQARGIFTLFATKAAYHIIKHSKANDVIIVPHMVFKFFNAISIEERVYANGWICYTALNLNVLNTPRFAEGHKADYLYKQERQENKEDLELTGDTPW